MFFAGFLGKKVGKKVSFLWFETIGLSLLLISLNKLNLEAFEKISVGFSRQIWGFPQPTTLAIPPHVHVHYYQPLMTLNHTYLRMDIYIFIWIY